MTDVPTSVYVIASGDYVKIGFSIDPIKRLKSMRTGISERPHLVATRLFKSRTTARYVERLLHWQFREYRTHGEWFRVPARKAQTALQKCRQREMTPREVANVLGKIFTAQPRLLP
jgi:cation transport regulator ChaC